MTRAQINDVPLKTTVQPLATRLEVDQENDLITIHVGETLDGYATDIFTQAIEEAQRDVSNHLIVDLADTRHILESGLKLLIMLDERSWRMAGKVHIINCRPELENGIGHCLAPDVFNLSGDCKKLESCQ